MNNKHFVPSNFQIPEKLETALIKVRMLKVSDVVKDYDAVMSSLAHLQNTKPFGPDQTWPTGLTFEQNLIDLGWHQKEFQRKSSFAYTVVSPDETKCLGCIYIMPTNKLDYNASIHLWVRQSALATGLDEHLFTTAKEWIDNKWPFKRVAYPGRDIDWDEWQKQKESGDQ